MAITPLPALLFCLGVLAGAADAAPRPCEPELIVDVSDEDMAMPLGIVDDVAVAPDGTLYLLDETNCNIRRISASGEILEPIGRKGLGPGDLNMPQHLALFRDDRCVVVQDFSKHAQCFDGDGNACEPVDVSQLRGHYANVIYRRAAAGPNGDLIVAAITTRRTARTPGTSTRELGISAFVARVPAGSGRTEDLFVMADDTGSHSRDVVIPDEWVGYVDRGWDINKAGEILYADPSGACRVNIGHPADGAVHTIDLPEAPGDEAKVRALAARSDLENIPRVAAVYWLDDDYFMVVPAAEVEPDASPNRIKTVEVFDRRGTGYGRFTIRCEYDPDNDKIYIHNDVLVVFRGGMAVTRGAVGDFLPEELERPSAAEVTEIRVRAYRLFAALRGRSTQ